MANVFPKWSNWLPLKLAAALVLLGATAVGAWYYYVTPEYMRVGYQPDQPVWYSHKIHVEQLGMDCRYCHSYVDKSNHSNVPSTQTCMNCHSYVQTNSPRLEPVRQSWETGESIDWVRIHQAPDYVYFNHAVHVNRGISCVDCHGQVNEMDVVWHDQSQTMAWCLDCHRNPQNHLRPLDKVYDLTWSPEKEGETMVVEGQTLENPTQQEIGLILKTAWQVQPPETCAACHR
jgi:hypothetical protein